ncbi:MAG: radical SAM protein [Smithella sp.]
MPIGLNCVYVAVWKAGHEVVHIDLMTEEDWQSDIRETITSFNPDIIGISVRNVDDQNMENPRFFLDQVKEIIAYFRRFSKAPIVLSGAAYSIFPEEALDYLEADMGIQGEGELSFLILLDRFARSESLSDVPGLYLRGAGLQGKRIFEKKLDRFLLPGARLSAFSISNKKEFMVPIQTRRGCPMTCSYCPTGIIEGRKIRKRKPDLIIEEIMDHVKAGFNQFFFVDNTFNIPEDYAKEICRKIIESRLTISWWCIVYPGMIDDELARLMACAGCVEVSLEFESGSEQVLRKMNKKFSPAEARETSEILRAAGIKQMGSLLLGGPGETKESVEESLEFADSLKLDSLKIIVGIRIYPDTALAGTAIEEGLIKPDDNLLFPHFYVVPGLREWLYKTIHFWMKGRPNWSF